MNYGDWFIKQSSLSSKEDVKPKEVYMYKVLTLLLFSVIFMILMTTVLEPICKIVNDPGLTLIIIASTSMILTSLVIKEIRRLCRK